LTLFAVGTLASLVAAIVIEFYLVAAIMWGIEVICGSLGVVGGSFLALLAVTALYSYSRSVSHARLLMVYIAPLGALLGFIALLMVILNYNCPWGPLRVLALAYIFEVIVALRLTSDLKVYSETSAYGFLAGVSVFTLGLILLSISTASLYLSLAGNTLKLASFTVLAFRALHSPRPEASYSV